MEYSPAAARTSLAALRADFEQLNRVRADMDGSPAYWTAERRAGEWRLPRDSEAATASDRLLLLPMRADYYQPNAYMAVVPQPIIMHAQVSRQLENYARRMFLHYPIENSLARREHGVPMLIGRFDAVVDRAGNIQVCELDDVCSLWPALPQLNPIAESYVRALEEQLGLPIYTSELFQYRDGAFATSPRVRREYARISFFDDSGQVQEAYIPRTTPLKLAILEQNGMWWRQSQGNNDRKEDYYRGLLSRFYAHNEDHWRGDLHESWLLAGNRLQLKDVALSVRAYRDMPGFAEHMNRYGPRSITMAWERDSKWALVPEKLAALAANLDTAVAFGRSWQAEHPDQLLVFKALRGARTEHVAIFSSRGTKPRGVSSAAQIARKFGGEANNPVIIQPYMEPDRLDRAGVNFLETDIRDIRRLNHVGQNPGAHVVPGQENRFAMIFRTFVVYLPSEQRVVHVGGMWQATDGRIVHGGAHSVCGPLYVDGMAAHGSAKRTPALVDAEAFVRAQAAQERAKKPARAISTTSPPTLAAK